MKMYHTNNSCKCVSVLYNVYEKTLYTLYSKLYTLYTVYEKTELTVKLNISKFLTDIMIFYYYRPGQRTVVDGNCRLKENLKFLVMK